MALVNGGFLHYTNMKKFWKILLRSIDLYHWKVVCLKLTPSVFFNPFPNKPWFLRVCSISLLKTPWEKEKLLVTSNFSFSHSVFYHFGEIPAIFI